MKGKVNPDQYTIFKTTLKKEQRPIIGKKLGSKEVKLVLDSGKNVATKEVSVSLTDRRSYCLSDDDILILANWAMVIETYFSKHAGQHQPMDIEWAKDGKTNQLYIVQARPETVEARKDRTFMEKYELVDSSDVLIQGLAIGAKIGAGVVQVIKKTSDIETFKKGNILVTQMTDPDWVPIMKLASAIVTNSGGRTCHAAIVSRELGIPAIVATKNATEVLKNGQRVTVSCSEGETGNVYKGILSFQIKKIKTTGNQETKTQVLLNIAQPDRAFECSFFPNQGVGLARTEFIFTDYIKIHPLALLNFDTIKDKALRSQIEELTFGYKDKRAYFVDKLAMGIATIAAAFYPKDVIVRTSDFKTNEYRSLLGGEVYEPVESNPMIGWRGASRYYDPKYQDAFLLECEAFKKVREVMGLTNVVMMIPFCRTPEEGKRVLEVAKLAGLERGKNGFRVFVMVELPSNIILADQFAKIFDGFSIGSNDLTQLTLGVDRDSEFVSHLYNERDESVLQSIRHVIKVAKKHHKKIGICGQAPSDFPDFAEFLVREGIDSISLNPDTVVDTITHVKSVESRGKKKR